MSMLIVVLYGSTGERRQMKGVLSRYFNENNIPFKLRQASSSAQFMNDYLFNHKIHLFMICIGGEITCILKSYNDFNLHTSRYTTDTVKFPLTYDDVGDKIGKKLKLSYFYNWKGKETRLSLICPYGTYTLKNRKGVRKILHEEIEYIHREEKGKSVIHLSNGETETTYKSLNQLERELDRKYFVKCNKKYLINFLNIYMVNDNWDGVYMKSGIEIPFTKKGLKMFYKSMTMSLLGINIFTY